MAFSERKQYKENVTKFLSLSLYFIISNGLVILRIRNLKAIVNSYLQMHLNNYFAITHTSVFHLSSAN